MQGNLRCTKKYLVLSALSILLFWTATPPARSEAEPNHHPSQATVVRVGSGAPAPGTVSVPIELVAQGRENAIGFSLTFDQNILTNPQATLGADATAAAAVLNTNVSQTAQGRLGILLALPANQSFSAGTRHILTVVFTLAPNTTAISATIGFGDQPIAQEVADVNANIVTTTFTPATITIQGYEADVAPRSSGNGQVTVTDWTQVGRFVAGLDTATVGGEYQRADCAPRSSLGDGRLAASDYTQAGRYAASLDPPVPAGGPTGPPAAALAATFDAESLPAPANDQVEMIRWLRAIDAGSENGTHSLAFDLDARGGENAISFSLSFDPRQWRFVSATTGADTGEASIIINGEETAAGRLGVVVALPAGHRLMAGARRIVIINFDLLFDQRDNHRLRAGSIEFSDYPAAREVADVEANALPAIFGFGRPSSQGRRP